jgi:hypothetical protein
MLLHVLPLPIFNIESGALVMLHSFYLINFRGAKLELSTYEPEILYFSAMGTVVEAPAVVTEKEVCVCHYLLLLITCIY